MVPAAAAEAAAEAAGEKLDAIEVGDEAEYLFDAYEDIGGVEDPAKYYKVIAMGGWWWFAECEVIRMAAVKAS
jgi:hypothetical protein